MCNLKAIIQELIPWRALPYSFKFIYTTSHQETYDINVMQRICVYSDINSDLILTLIEMCLVKQYIYNL